MEEDYVTLEADEEYLLFEEKVDKYTFQLFAELFRMSVDNNLDGLTDNQKEVLTGVSLGKRYGTLMKDMDKRHVASIQSALKGGIKKIVESVNAVVWLYNNPQLIKWLEKHGEKHVAEKTDK